MKKKHIINIIPYKGLDERIVKDIEIFLNEKEYLKAVICLEDSIPTSAYNSSRHQYLSTTLLLHLRKENRDLEGKILGLTDMDIYTEGMNYILGLAEINGRCIVVSCARLDERFYNREENYDLLITRLKKEVLHEIGHSLGLEHCNNELCVMYFSNNLRDTDYKSDRFCSSCQNKI